MEKWVVVATGTRAIAQNTASGTERPARQTARSIAAAASAPMMALAIAPVQPTAMAICKVVALKARAAAAPAPGMAVCVMFQARSIAALEAMMATTFAPVLLILTWLAVAL